MLYPAQLRVLTFTAPLHNGFGRLVRGSGASHIDRLGFRLRLHKSSLNLFTLSLYLLDNLSELGHYGLDHFLDLLFGFLNSRPMTAQCSDSHSTPLSQLHSVQFNDYITQNKTGVQSYRTPESPVRQRNCVNVQIRNINTR